MTEETAVQIFTLRTTDEFIALNKLLKVISIAQSGGHARAIIEADEVQVNGKIESQIRKKLRAGDLVLVGGTCIEINAAPKTDEEE